MLHLWPIINSYHEKFLNLKLYLNCRLFYNLVQIFKTLTRGEDIKPVHLERLLLSAQFYYIKF